jgi:hypothetical protein
MPEMRLCEACGMEYDWAGVQRQNYEYCCAGCADGGECTCPQHNHQYHTSQSLPEAAANQTGVTKD